MSVRGEKLDKLIKFSCQNYEELRSTQNVEARCVLIMIIV